MAKRINLDLATSIDTPSVSENKTATLKVPKIKKAKNNFELIESFLMQNFDFRLNEISVELEISPKGDNKWELLNENNVYYQLYKSGFKSFQSIVQTLLKNDFTRQRFNPFKSYFNGLEAFDEAKEGDLITQLANFVEVEKENRELFNDNFKKMLVRAVACAVKAIPFNKQAFVLQGKQNDGKSSFIRYLIPPDLDKYYTDMFDPENKDDIKRLASCLIINIDEMVSLSKRDINKIKSIMSLASVKMRLPYDPRDSDLPRVASFFGTTNEPEFLSDHTGSVRWIVFKVLSINHDNGGKNGYCSIDINRVWAQAVTLLRSGYNFKLSDENLKELEKINAEYQIQTMEKQYIMRYFEPCEHGHEVLTTSEIIEHIKYSHKDLQLNMIMVGRALTELKFERGQKFTGKYQVKGYKIKRVEQTETPPSVSDQISPAAATSYRVDKRLIDSKLKKKNESIVNETQKELTESDLPF